MNSLMKPNLHIYCHYDNSYCFPFEEEGIVAVAVAMVEELPAIRLFRNYYHTIFRHIRLLNIMLLRCSLL